MLEQTDSLPELVDDVLLNIFRYLSWKDLFQAELACKKWTELVKIIWTVKSLKFNNKEVWELYLKFCNSSQKFDYKTWNRKMAHIWKPVFNRCASNLTHLSLCRRTIVTGHDMNLIVKICTNVRKLSFKELIILPEVIEELGKMTNLKNLKFCDVRILYMISSISVPVKFGVYEKCFRREEVSTLIAEDDESSFPFQIVDEADLTRNLSICFEKLGNLFELVLTSDIFFDDDEFPVLFNQQFVLTVTSNLQKLVIMIKNPLSEKNILIQFFEMHTNLKSLAISYYFPDSFIGDDQNEIEVAFIEVLEAIVKNCIVLEELKISYEYFGTKRNIFSSLNFSQISSLKYFHYKGGDFVGFDENVEAIISDSLNSAPNLEWLSFDVYDINIEGIFENVTLSNLRFLHVYLHDHFEYIDLSNANLIAILSNNPHLSEIYTHIPFDIETTCKLASLCPNVRKLHLSEMINQSFGDALIYGIFGCANRPKSLPLTIYIDSSIYDCDPFSLNMMPADLLDLPIHIIYDELQHSVQFPSK